MFNMILRNYSDNISTILEYYKIYYDIIVIVLTIPIVNKRSMRLDLYSI